MAMTGQHRRHQGQAEGQGQYRLGPWLMLALIISVIAIIALFIASHINDWIIVE
jgi:hypothetical protein